MSKLHNRKTGLRPSATGQNPPSFGQPKQILTAQQLDGAILRCGQQRVDAIEVAHGSNGSGKKLECARMSDLQCHQRVATPETQHATRSTQHRNATWIN